jgi:hypothetical protein
MLIIETKELYGNKYKYTYSSLGYYIQDKDGIEYVDAYDALDSDKEYKETDKPIEENE